MTPLHLGTPTAFLWRAHDNAAWGDDVQYHGILDQSVPRERSKSFSYFLSNTDRNED